MDFFREVGDILKRYSKAGFAHGPGQLVVGSPAGAGNSTR